MKIALLTRWVGAGALALAACGHATRHAVDLQGCSPARIHTGAPPSWTAAAWSDSSPGFTAPYTLASGDAAAAFMFAEPLRAGHPTDPANKVLWVMRYPRNGKPLRITARWSADPSLSVRISQPANSSPGEIYPTSVDLPRAGCWKLDLTWAQHSASIDLQVLPRHSAPGAAPATAQAAIPAPLHGLPLRVQTGLRLLVSADPPVVLDVDTGRATRVTGLNTTGHPVLTVIPIGRDAVLWLDRHTGPTPRAEIYLVPHGTAHATLIASGWEVAPAAGDRAIWLLAYQTPDRCTLSRVGLNGRVQERPQPIPCSTQLFDAGSRAVLIDHHRISDPATGYTFPGATTGTLWAIGRDRALTSTRSGPPLALTDLHNGSRQRLPWPSQIRGRQAGTYEAVVEPREQLIALDFADPAYHLTATQLIDVWLLDTASRRFRHLPDMPAAVQIKFTSIAWSGDGRLVMLARTGGPGSGRDVVAVWKPGQRQLAVRPVRLPTRDSGSPTFAVW